MAQLKVRTDLFEVPSAAPEEQVNTFDIDSNLMEFLVGMQDFLRSEHLLFPFDVFHAFNCEQCSYGTDEMSELEDHKHTHEDVLQCFICNKVFKYERSLIRHRKTHEADEFEADMIVQETVHQCDICNKTYKYERTLERHKLTHATELTDENSNNIENKPSMNLKKETQSIAQGTVHQCDICSKIYKYEGTLRRHRLKHTLEGTDVNGNNLDTKCQMTTRLVRVPTKKRTRELLDEVNVDDKCSLNRYILKSEFLYSVSKLEQTIKPRMSYSNTISHPCTKCHKIYKMKPSLIRHMQKMHYVPPSQKLISSFFNMKPTIKGE